MNQSGAMQMQRLGNELLERVLLKLGASSKPEPKLEGLRDIYNGWCRRVPFDNVRKLVQLKTGSRAPFPGTEATEFFESWLKHGTGGTCWSSAGALHALLSALGFRAERGVATMLVAPNLPPNHGTVVVTVEGKRHLVDCSILHGEPLELNPLKETSVDHPAWGVRCRRRDGLWHVAWRPLHKPDGFECRYDWFGASAEEFHRRYEETRPWSPFNYEVTARINRGDAVTGVSFGQEVLLASDGTVVQKPISSVDKKRFLVEVIGMSEEIVSQLPEDVPTPPPPGSKAAKKQPAAIA